MDGMTKWHPSEEAAEAKEGALAAVALAGGAVHPFTLELVDRMCCGEITGDQAVDAIRARFVDPGTLDPA